MAKDRWFKYGEEITQSEYEEFVAQMSEIDKEWTLTDKIEKDHIVHMIEYI